MRNRGFTLAIEGENVSPKTVGVRDLLEILASFETAAALTAQSAGAKTGDDLSVSLVGIGPGSDVLTLAVSESMLRGAGIITRAIASDDFSGVPLSAHSHLRRVWMKAKSERWSLRFLPDGNGVVAAVISHDHEILRPGIISGQTTIYGKIDRVGGEGKPTAVIVTLTGERRTIQVRGRDLAKRLGDLLFQTVGLEGEAHWNTETWEMDDFRAERLTEYEPLDIASAFEKLRAAAGDRWDGVDPEEYLNSLRSDD